MILIFYGDGNERSMLMLINNTLLTYPIFSGLSELTLMKIYNTMEKRCYKKGSLIWAHNKKSKLNFDFIDFYKDSISSIQTDAFRAMVGGNSAKKLSLFEGILEQFSSANPK